MNSKFYYYSKSSLVTFLINAFCFTARMLFYFLVFKKELLTSILLVDATISLLVAVIFAKIFKIDGCKDQALNVLHSLLGWPGLAFGIYCYVEVELGKYD